LSRQISEYCKYLLADGRRQEVHFDKITYRIKKLCYGLNMEFVDPVRKITAGHDIAYAMEI